MRTFYYLGGRRGLTRLSTGQLFFVNTDARDISTWIIHHGVWENYVDDILWALARPGDTFVDVGANMGYYTVKVGGRIGPKGRLFAFEPNPNLFDVLSDNVRINGLSDRAQIFMAAAGEGPGAANLSFETRYPGGGHLGVGDDGVDPNMTTVQTPILSIDDQLGDSRVDLIKIDVEGFEPMVLKGLQRALARSPDAAVVTEVSFSQWARFGDPLALLRGFAGDRAIHIIRPSGKIELIPQDQLLAVLDRPLPSYVLLAPRNAQRDAQLKPFMSPYKALAPGDLGPQGGRRPSLGLRLLRRLRGF